MRSSFVNTLIDAVEHGPCVVIPSGDLGVAGQAFHEKRHALMPQALARTAWEASPDSRTS